MDGAQARQQQQLLCCAGGRSCRIPHSTGQSCSPGHWGGSPGLHCLCPVTLSCLHLFRWCSLSPAATSAAEFGALVWLVVSVLPPVLLWQEEEEEEEVFAAHGGSFSKWSLGLKVLVWGQKSRTLGGSEHGCWGRRGGTELALWKRAAAIRGNSSFLHLAWPYFLSITHPAPLPPPCSHPHILPGLIFFSRPHRSSLLGKMLSRSLSPGPVLLLGAAPGTLRGAQRGLWWQLCCLLFSAHLQGSWVISWASCDAGARGGAVCCTRDNVGFCFAPRRCWGKFPQSSLVWPWGRVSWSTPGNSWQNQLLT